MGRCNSRIILPINTTKCQSGKLYVFLHETFKVVRILLSGTWSYPSIMDIVEAMNTLFQERHNRSENCITVRVSRRTQKNEIYLANEQSGLAFLITDLGQIFGTNVGNKFGVMLRRRNLTNKNLITTLSAYILS